MHFFDSRGDPKLNCKCALRLRPSCPRTSSSCKSAQRGRTRGGCGLGLVFMRWKGSERDEVSRGTTSVGTGWPPPTKGRRTRGGSMELKLKRERSAWPHAFSISIRPLFRMARAYSRAAVARSVRRGADACWRGKYFMSVTARTGHISKAAVASTFEQLGQGESKETLTPRSQLKPDTSCAKTPTALLGLASAKLAMSTCCGDGHSCAQMRSGTLD
eukprot:6193776-Pleurochrysis_carterae.AAC.1